MAGRALLGEPAVAPGASRFEGDADGDGDVDDDDFGILSGELGLMSCGCNCGGESMMAGGGNDLAALKQRLPESPDVDGNGDVDDADFAAVDAIVAGAGTSEWDAVESETVEGEPALAN